MRQKIEQYVDFHGLSVRVDHFIDLWSKSNGRSVKELPFKRDLRYWNDGPTAMKPLKMVACLDYRGECLRVFEIWERQDGFGMEVFKFDDFEDYNDYSPSDEMPSAIKKEIGLCENYHKGI